MKKLTKDFVKALIIRAIWTMAEAALSMITIGATVTEVQWGHILSVSLVAGVYSVLKSVVTGLPEVAPEVTFNNDSQIK